ncbi:MAG TPA: hypothetical protein VFU07_06295 [Candidatus Lumbricidophila sp.]|nr:hypothetical protein [Candidatus Lumbricidophila sp.]
MKTIVALTSGSIVGAVLGLAALTPASAATLWDNNNYTGTFYSASSAPNVGTLNDRGSSVQASGSYAYYE